MGEDIVYSDQALMNRLLYLTDNNEINVFVEDEFKEFEYECILNRLFNKKIKIDHIFPMRGKPGVKNAHKEYGDSFSGKPNIYIVDGDFDLILEKEVVSAPNFIYLDRYNIESYYIDKESIIKFMVGKLKKREHEVIEIINYDFWYKDTIMKLEKLFLNYVVAQEKLPNEKNVGLSRYTYIENKSGIISETQIDKYITNIKSKINNYEMYYDFYKRKYEEIFNGNPKKIICGKYILSSLTQYMRKKARVSFKEEDLKFYLICDFDIRSLEYLKKKIYCFIDNKLYNISK